LASSSNETEFQATNPDDPSTWTATGNDSAFVFTTYTYDYLGRPLVTVNQGDNSSRSLTYSGCACAGGGSITTIDEVNRQQTQIYDALGRVSQVNVFKFDGTLDSQRTITYNGLTTTTQVVDLATSETQITTQIFDGFGRLQSQHSPQQTPGKNTIYAFNPDNTLLRLTDARGASTTYSYNNRGMLTLKTVNRPDGKPASGLTVTYAYDAAGNRTFMSDTSGTWTGDYDAFSRIQDETRTFAGVPGTFTLTYRRNLFGQLTQIQDPFGATFNFAHDASGALTSITGSGPNTVPTYVSQMSYLASGLPQLMQFGNGAAAHFVYYPSQNLKHYVVNGTTGSNVQDYRYSYTPDRRVSQLTDNIDNNLNRSFVFDHQGRLTEAHTGSSIGQNCDSVDFIHVTTWYCESFQFDAFGNPLVSNMISSVGSTFGPFLPVNATYTNNRNTAWLYDDDGRPLTQDANETNSYDAAGHLVTTVNTNGLHGTAKQKITIQTVFDGDDALAAQTTQTTTDLTTKYFLRSSALNGAVVAEINPSGMELTSFVYANGTLVARNETPQAPSVPGTFWVHRDPVTGSEFRTSTPAVNISTQETQLDPLGRNFGLSGVGSFITAAVGYPDVGAFYDLSGGCTLDGWAIPCATLLSWIQYSDGFEPDPAFGAVNTIFDRPGGPYNGTPPSDDPNTGTQSTDPDTPRFDSSSTDYLALDTSNVDGPTKKRPKWDAYVVIERYPDGHMEYVIYFGYGPSLAQRIAASEALAWSQYQLASQQQAQRQQATQPKYSLAASVFGGFLNGITLPFDLFARAILGHDVKDRQITGAAQASHPVAGGAAEFLGALVTVPVGGEADLLELGINAADVEAAKATGNVYSVAFEMKLDPVDVARSDSVHFNRANRALDAAIKSDADFAEMMEELIPGVSEDVSSVGGRDVPAGWTWHHAQDYGMMQLVPRVQHESSLFREVFHPGGTGGYADWAVPAGAPLRH